MTTINLPSGEYLLVDVPPRSWGYDLYGGMKADQLLCLTTTAPGRFKQHKINIPPGSYTLIGKGSEITEEVAKGIVQQHAYGYRNYTPNMTVKFAYKTALESFDSLLRSHGKEPGTTVVLKKEIL